nr:hypothetical protein [Tanacetum cinerariifolium]
MDLFAFIHHVDPTKVWIGERQIEEGHVLLLDSNKGRVILLIVRDDHGGQNDDIENCNEGSGGVGLENHSKGDDCAGQDDNIVVDDDVQAANVINDYSLDDPETCLSAEVRLRSEHTFRERKKFERKCAKHTDLLKEKDAEITSSKS